MNASVLEIANLSVAINEKQLLQDLTFSVRAGERLGFIGGSGSGKTLTALAISGLLPEHATVTGSIKLGDQQIIGMKESSLAKIRGDLIGMVFQEPKSALNPLRKLGSQITEALTNHYTLSKKQRRETALKLASRVGISEPERIINSYPHEVSGGQRQRAAIASAISASPSLLIADEPTTALDVTVQKGIIELFNALSTDNKTSLIFITHDLAVLSQVADRILVFHDGKIIESGTAKQLIQNPKTEVTKELTLAAESVTTKRLLEKSSIFSAGDASEFN